MDTNDRGMIDIERFDLEPERPILHGLVGNIELNKLNGLTNEEKIPYILPMVGIDSISPRLKASMMEIEQTITSWPQLSSSVALGGAIITDVSRRILLNQMSTSGRFYIDLDELIPNDLIKNSEFYNPDNEPKEKGLDYFSDLIFESNNLVNAPIIVDEKTIKEIVNAACLAPSGGNMQPWKWIWNKNTLFLFHEKASSFSFLDYNNLGSYIAFGAAIENIKIVSSTYNLKPKIEYFPLSKNKELIAIIQFEEIKMNVDELTKGIYSRNTNRKLNERVVIEKGVLNEIALALNAFENTFVKWINDENEIEIVADIVTTTDKIRILQPQGHYDLFNKEIRWNAKQVNETKDGIDIDTLEISNGEKAAMKLATDQNAIDYLRKWNLGDGFKKISMKSVQKSGAIGLIYFNKKDELSYFNAGSALQRVWIKANNLGLSFHPISACTFMFQRILEENESSFNDKNTEKLKELHKKFNNLWKFNETETGVFMFKLHLSNDTSIRSLRKPLDEMFRYK
jgi:nitroreductase